MNKLELRSLSQLEYSAWEKDTRKSYALEKEKSGLTSEEAEAESEKSFSTLLPQGAATPEQFVYAVSEISTGLMVGNFWWASKKNGRAWIYDIAILPEFRGLGYGRETMLLGQADMKAKGISRLELHVFGHNDIAQNLYRSLGFQVTNVVMAKDL